MTYQEEQVPAIPLLPARTATARALSIAQQHSVSAVSMVGLFTLVVFLDINSLGVSGTGKRGMNREGVPGKSPEEMYIQQKVRVLLMLRKMGSNVSTARPLAVKLPGCCWSRMLASLQVSVLVIIQ